MNEVVKIAVADRAKVLYMHAYTDKTAAYKWTVMALDGDMKPNILVLKLRAVFKAF